MDGSRFYKEMQHMFRRYFGDRGDSQGSSQTNSTGELVAEVFTKQLFPSTTKAITLFFCYECFILGILKSGQQPGIV